MVAKIKVLDSIYQYRVFFSITSPDFVCFSVYIINIFCDFSDSCDTEFLPD